MEMPKPKRAHAGQPKGRVKPHKSAAQEPNGGMFGAKRSEEAIAYDEAVAESIIAKRSLQAEDAKRALLFRTPSPAAPPGGPKISPGDMLGLPVFYKDDCEAWAPAVVTAATGSVGHVASISISTAVGNAPGHTVVDPPRDRIKPREVDTPGVALRGFCSGCRQTKPRDQLRHPQCSLPATNTLPGSVVACHTCRIKPAAGKRRRLRSTDAAVTAAHEAEARKKKIAGGEGCVTGVIAQGQGLPHRTAVTAARPVPVDPAKPSQDRHSVRGARLEDAVRRMTCRGGWSGVCCGTLEPKLREHQAEGSIRYDATCTACSAPDSIEFGDPEHDEGAASMGCRNLSELTARVAELVSRGEAKQGKMKAAVSGRPEAVGHSPAGNKGFHEIVGPIVDRLAREKMLLQQQTCKLKGCNVNGAFAADGCWKERRNSDTGG